MNTDQRIRILIANATPLMLSALQRAVAEKGLDADLVAVPEDEALNELKTLTRPGRIDVVMEALPEPPRKRKFERAPKFLRKGQRR